MVFLVPYVSGIWTSLNSDLILGLSQFLPDPDALPQKVSLVSKGVKSDIKIIISLPQFRCLPKLENYHLLQNLSIKSGSKIIILFVVVFHQCLV